MMLVAVGLARLRQQDQRRCIGGLGGEDEIKQNERVLVPVVDEPDHIECDPGGDDEALSQDVPRRSEEPRHLLSTPPEPIVAEGAALRTHRMRG
jgi:hypothetical protein